MDLAKRIAYQQLSFRETVRDPPLLLATAIVRPMFRPQGMSAEEDERLWEFGLRLYEATIVEGKISTQQLGVLAAAQLTPLLVPGALRPFEKYPELAAPLAYFQALRLITQRNFDLAAKCMKITLTHASPESRLAALARAELEAITMQQ